MRHNHTQTDTDTQTYTNARSTRLNIWPSLPWGWTVALMIWTSDQAGLSVCLLAWLEQYLHSLYSCPSVSLSAFQMLAICICLSVCLSVRLLAVKRDESKILHYPTQRSNRVCVCTYDVFISTDEADIRKALFKQCAQQLINWAFYTCYFLLFSLHL